MLKGMARRRLHFLGTMPQFPDARAAFSWQLGEEVRGQLRRLSGGETGPRLMWFVPLVKELKARPEIRAVRDGDWTSYEDTDLLTVRHGQRLHIPLRLAQYAAEDRAALASVVDGDPGLPLQVGIPGYLDMALFTFGPLGAIRHSRRFLLAVAEQIADIAAPDVVFQLEVPAALIAVASAPAFLRPAMANFMAYLVTRQVARAPEGSRFGVHLCLGDLGHRALRQLPDAGPLVLLANAIVRRWPDGRVLEYVHLPMSGGDEPPSTDGEFYAPLRRLREMPLIAGIAHELQDSGDQLRVRELVEQAVGRSVDIATNCGLGRRSAEEAERAVQAMLKLVAD
ncbi:hypothetical protein [Kutzneria sp. CA-103260]|uniref:hypothetical protein n=1 Tax=Kutzneria sp. CA-103260 TaxID=2802641 RepID=UPI001BA87589|nr:hypothetical protein [Kutzneria sp. CA-103260]QUQ66306.1 hypothetical protein JJ691_40330 [Kutzneria sp. CA-103260]